jgi:hypothetical protein
LIESVLIAEKIGLLFAMSHLAVASAFDDRDTVDEVSKQIIGLLNLEKKIENNDKISSDEVTYLSPSMPNISKIEPTKIFKFGSNYIFFQKKLPTIAGGTEFSKFISYIYTMTVIDNNQKPIFIVTFEESSAGVAFLCVFDRLGNHLNFGKHVEMWDEEVFISKALSIIKKEFSITSEIEVLKSH